MVQKHWTLQRVLLLVIFILYIAFKLMIEDDIPIGLAIGAIVAGAVGTLTYFAVRKKGIFAKK